MITSTGWGGLEMNVLQLALWMQERGHSIEFAAPSGTRLSDELERAGFSRHPFQLHKKYFDTKGAKALIDIVGKCPNPILWVFDNKDLDVASIAKRKSKDFKFVYQQHMQIGISKRGWAHTRRYAQIDAWISPLQWLKDEVGEKTKFPIERVHVIPLGIDIGKFEEALIDKGEAQRKFGLDPHLKTVGMIGRIDPGKGQLLVTRALQGMKDAEQLQLLLIGEPTINDPSCIQYNEELEHAIGENEALKVVKLGYTDSPGEFYSAIDLFVLGSTGETYGMVTLEAMLAGLEVIATNSSGTPEILNNGALGRLYEPNNIESLQQQVEEWLKGSTTHGAQAKEHVKTNYNHQTELEQIESLLASL